MNQYQFLGQNVTYIVACTISNKVVLSYLHTCSVYNGNTVDGRIPAPVNMWRIPLFAGFYTSKVGFRRISSINSMFIYIYMYIYICIYINPSNVSARIVSTARGEASQLSAELASATNAIQAARETMMEWQLRHGAHFLWYFYVCFLI